MITEEYQSEKKESKVINIQVNKKWHSEDINITQNIVLVKLKVIDKQL